MENFIEILIYLLIIVGSGLIQAFQSKKKKQQQNTDTPPPSPPRGRREVSSPEADTTTRRPATSFEDIFRELMGQPTEPEPEPYRPPVRKVQRERRMQESEAYQSTSDTYRKAVDEADKAQKLNDRIDLENLDDFIQPRRMSVTKTKKSKFAKEVKEMLQNPESARKAVILSEILNRKHF